MEIIKKNKFDKRLFVGGKLKNNIKYILIQDSILTKSYISISVNVGSYCNPKKYDGLAHFLEHMLFMGSKKYPDENYFNKILNKYGGESNAYTSDMQTVYFFNVFNEGLIEIIDIFSRFFIDPLFSNNSLNREIKAVHSEYEKFLNNDNYAIYQFIHYLINNNLTINNFFCGNLNTLNKSDLREKMIEFYNKYYISSNISICIMSNLSIDNMYNIINTTFSNIPYKKNNNIIFNKPLFDNNYTYHFKSIANIFKVIYIWEIPNNIELLYTNDFNIFSNILNNISNTSLYYYLKNIGYLNNINIEINDIGIFILELSLTLEGFNKLYYIEYILFLTIKQIINSNINKYAKYIKTINYINYNCLSKEESQDLCNLLSTKHFIYKTKYLYKLLYIIKKIKNNKDYQDIYKKYIKSNNYIRILVSNNYIINKKYYNELYQYINHSYCLLKNYKSIVNKLFTNNFDINKKYIKYIKYYNNLNILNTNIDNKYLDININLYNKINNKYNIPILLKKNIWYGGNSNFNEPIIYINLLLYNNKYYSSPLNYILTELSCTIINHIISSYLFNAYDVGYNISIIPSYYNELINISINGPNDINKLKIIIKDISFLIKNINEYFIKLSKLYIDNLLITYSQKIKNILLLNSWELSSILLKPFILPTTYDINILLNTLKTINYNIIKKYINNLFDDAYIINFIYGNINYKYIDNIVDDIINNIKCCKYKDYNINKLTNNTFIHPNKKEISNCITYYYNIDNFSPILFCLINIFINIYQNNFFDELRTKQQLGYLVSMYYNNIKNNYFIIQKIQSSQDINYVKNKIDEFNNNLLNLLSEKKFNDAKNILKNELLSPENSLSDVYSIYLNEIINQYYLFDRKKIILNELNNITINNIIDFIKKYITLENCNIIYVKSN